MKHGNSSAFVITGRIFTTNVFEIFIESNSIRLFILFGCSEGRWDGCRTSWASKIHYSLFCNRSRANELAERFRPLPLPVHSRSRNQRTRSSWRMGWWVLGKDSVIDQHTIKYTSNKMLFLVYIQQL